MEKIAIWGSRLTLGNMLILGRYMKDSLPYDVSVQLFSKSSGLGALYNLEELSNNLNYYYWSCGDYKNIVKNLLTANHLIVVSDSAWKYLKKIKKEPQFKKYKKKLKLSSNLKTVSLICTAGGYLRDHMTWNKMMKNNNIYPYIMPDLFGGSEIEHVPYYHAMDSFLIDSICNKISYKSVKDNFIISHSPGDDKRIKYNMKGTVQIIEVINKIKNKYPNIILNVIKNRSWKDCLKIKASSHIFIDQVIKGNIHAQNFYINHKKNVHYHGKKIYEGGLGKSGLESLLLPCVTICGGSYPNTEKFFPSPPISFISLNELEDKIIYYIKNENIRQEDAKKERKWAIKYLGAEFISWHLTRHIREYNENKRMVKKK